jgi:hypothetical protein
MTAMPRVKPSTTGSGMYCMYRPAPAKASAMRKTPAMMPTTSTPDPPNWATMGSSTTVIAPVGPLTCRLLPPKTAATNPATIAVTSPAAAPMPEATPKARASGRATKATVTPATMSRLGLRRMAV